MRKSLIVSLLIILLFTSCPLDFQSEKNKNSLVVTTWNVQNIFDAVDNGNEYEEYLHTSGWTEQAYKKRLTNLATVLSYEELSDTDVLILNEVENNNVIEDIMNLDVLKKRGFLYYASAGEQNGAIKTAVISRIPIVDAQIHSIPDVRPVLQVELQNEGEHIFILAIHAKSNLGGKDETAHNRTTLCKVFYCNARIIEEKYPNALILIAGDFNESYTDKNMMCDARNASYTSLDSQLKLLPDFVDGFWFCPWMKSDTDPNFQAQGSYCYRGTWCCYDNILISSAGKDNYGWEYDSSGVVFHGILQTTSLTPNAYRRDLLTGVSDHLPVWVKFTK